MKTAYVTEQGATVRRDGPVLQVWTGKTRRAELLVHDLDQLVLIGNIILTPAVLDFLIEQGVDTVFLSLHGRYRGRLMHRHSKNVRLRIEQYNKLQDPSVVLEVARRIVHAKIMNSRAFLMRSARRVGGDEKIAAAAEQVRGAVERLDNAASLDQVRGIEGYASAAYFGVFGRLLKNEQFSFAGRNRRPPLDPVNVLLSLGYTLLANTVETAIQIVGLDPYLGALHAVEYGRPSLVCDLMEEYRPVLVDPMVVACVNQRSFSPDDFEGCAGATDPLAVEGPVRFKRAAMRWFLELYERRLRNEIGYEPRNQRLSWRQVIEEQVRQFARFLMGTEPAYEPLYVR